MFEVAGNKIASTLAEILISGISTEGGVDGTARSARNLGYDVVVLKGLCRLAQP